MVSAAVRSLMKKNEGLARSREKLALKVKRYNAMIRVIKEKVRKQLLKEARANMAGTKKKKKKCGDGRGRSERWPNRCWQCCHRRRGGKGGKIHQKHLCKATNKWLDRQ